MQPKYLEDGHLCRITQLFGENKNQSFYGPSGHTALDIRTQGSYKYEWANQPNFADGIVGNEERKRVDRDVWEKFGRLPLVSSHAGFLETNVFTFDRRNGWGVYVTTDWLDEDNKKVRYQTVYWHIDTPWRTLAKYNNEVAPFDPVHIGKGSIIAISGNTGYPNYSTGPHLHFEFKRQVEGEPWFIIDPLPHFDDIDVVYTKGSQRWYRGKEITNDEYKIIRETLPKIV